MVQLSPEQIAKLNIIALKFNQTGQSLLDKIIDDFVKSSPSATDADIINDVKEGFFVLGAKRGCIYPFDVNDIVSIKANDELFSLYYGGGCELERSGSYWLIETVHGELFIVMEVYDDDGFLDAQSAKAIGDPVDWLKRMNAASKKSFIPIEHVDELAKRIREKTKSL